MSDCQVRDWDIGVVMEQRDERDEPFSIPRGRDATPEDRLANVARALVVKLTHNTVPDFADFRDVFKPFIQRELLIARLAEAKLDAARVLNDRAAAIEVELRMVEREIPSHLRIYA